MPPVHAALPLHRQPCCGCTFPALWYEMFFAHVNIHVFYSSRYFTDLATHSTCCAVERLQGMVLSSSFEVHGSSEHCGCRVQARDHSRVIVHSAACRRACWYGSQCLCHDLRRGFSRCCSRTSQHPSCQKPRQCSPPRSRPATCEMCARWYLKLMKQAGRHWGHLKALPPLGSFHWSVPPRQR